MLLSEGELVHATEDLVGAGGERLPERVLSTIADRHTSFSDIRIAITTLPTRSLAELERNRLITKLVPVTAPHSKLTYYRITDNFLAFWLSVIGPHRQAWFDLWQISYGLSPPVRRSLTHLKEFLLLQQKIFSHDLSSRRNRYHTHPVS